MKGLEPKQMTVWIDGDVYQAMLVAKARGGGSLKRQINEALRHELGVKAVAELEAQEREAWLKKPWSEEDQAEVEAWQTVQDWGKE